jgi:hypothetical protein
VVDGVPQKHGANKTFAYKREKTIATSLNDEQIKKFLHTMKGFGEMQFLFAYIHLNGARRV